MEINDAKICPSCGTANKPDFSFCKNCGARLYSQPRTNSSDSRTPAYIPKEYQKSVPDYESGNISSEEMSAFIGESSNVYLSKFSAMKSRAGKISWLWPVFFLTLLFGIFGAALWAFYRKMYKPAFILLAISILVFGINFHYGVMLPVKAAAADGFFLRLADVANLSSEQFIETFAKYFSNVSTPFDTALSLLKYAVIILCSMFACPLYERFAVKRISKIKSQNPAVSVEQLKKAGGTSAGSAVAVGVISYLIITVLTVAAFVCFIF